MTDLVVGTIIGWLVFLLCNGALAYAAHLLSERFFSDAPCAVRWAVAGVAFVAFVLSITQALSLLSLYNRPAVVVASLLLASLSHGLWKGYRNLEGEAELLKTWIGAVAGSRGAVLLCAAVLALFLAAARGLGSPPLDWDSLTYHLFFAARYVQLQTLAGFVGPPVMDYYAHFPVNGEMMTAWLLLPFCGDLLVSLLGFFFLALGALATYGLCRELGVGWEDASLATCLVCFSPLLFAWVTTQGVDIQVFAGLMCGALFTMRYLLYGHGREAIAGFVAIGIALGTKHTALALGAILLALLTCAPFAHHRPRRDWAGMAAMLVCGLLLVGIVGGRSYLTNWRETGNPFYPQEITIAGHEMLAGSSYTQMLSENGKHGSRRDDLRQFVNMFNYFSTRGFARSAGPKFPLLLLLALGSLGLYRASESRRWPVRLLAGCGVLGMLAFYLPGNGLPALARRLWPDAARFLATPFSLLAVAAMPTVARLRTLCPALVAILVCFALWDMLVANNFVSASFPLLVGPGTAILVLTGLLIPWNRWRARLSGGILVALLVVVGTGAACLLQVIREGNRWIRYAGSIDVHGFPRDFVDGWEYCDRPDHPLRIALVAGWEHLGQNWFYYPLLGRRLQNTVVYVSADAPNPQVRPDSDTLHAGLSRTWVDNLRHQRVDVVFVEKPWPIEETWLRERQDAFALLRDSDSFKIYEVLGK